MSNEDRQLLGPLSVSILQDSDAWRDRIPETLTPEQLEFMEWVRRPPWWRPIARWKHDRQECGFFSCRVKPVEDLVGQPTVLEYRRFPPRRPPWWRPVARWKYDRRKK